jgi:RNA polymerase sigma-70 factor (ECF subfamily)
MSMRKHAAYLQQPISVAYSQAQFREYMRITKPKLLAYVCSMLPFAESEEVVQDAYLKFYTYVNEQPCLLKLGIDYERFTALLFSMAKNLCISHLRHQNVINKYQQMKQSAQAQDSPDVETCMVKLDEKQKLMQAIDKLPPICRQVFVERKLNGKSHQQIAQKFNICTKTVENHIARGLKLCRQNMITHLKAQHDQQDTLPSSIANKRIGD